MNHRPSLVWAMLGTWRPFSAAWRQVWRNSGARRMTQFIRSSSVFLATASWTAQERCWPWPVRLPVDQGGEITMVSCSPAMW